MPLTPGASSGSPSSPPPDPLLSITRGNPSARDTAAVVAVLSALAARAARLEQAAQPSPRVAQRSEWSARYRLLRPPLQRGPGGWRASALPR